MLVEVKLVHEVEVRRQSQPLRGLLVREVKLEHEEEVRRSAAAVSFWGPSSFKLASVKIAFPFPKVQPTSSVSTEDEQCEPQGRGKGLGSGGESGLRAEDEVELHVDGVRGGHYGGRRR